MPSLTITVPDSKWEEFCTGFLGAYPIDRTTWEGTDGEWITSCIEALVIGVYRKGKIELGKQAAVDATDQDILGE